MTLLALSHRSRSSVFLFITFILAYSNQGQSQNFCLVDNFTFTLSGSGAGEKSFVGGNFHQSMTWSLEADFSFHAVKTGQDGDIVTYAITKPGSDTLHFSCAANDYFYPSPGITYFDSANYSITFIYGDNNTGYMEYSLCTGEVVFLWYPIKLYEPSNVDDIEPYALYYFGEEGLLDVDVVMRFPWVFWEHHHIAPGEVEIDLPEEEGALTLGLYTQNRFIAPGLHLLTKKEQGGPSVFGKVCADGSDTTTMFRLTICQNLENHSLRIKEDPEAQNAEVYGYLESKAAECGELDYWYRHPTGVYKEDGTPSAALYEEIHIQAVNGETGQVEMEMPVRIYRAPVVMVHGLWSDANAFSTMDFELTDVATADWTSQLTNVINYKSTNDRAFAVNDSVVLKGIRSEMKSAFFWGYSTSRVNLVGHSMGGLLSRMFIQSTDYQDDVCRFITINTPHSGTQAANYLLGDDTCPRFLFGLKGNYVDRGAVEDLQCNSPALWGEGLVPGLNVFPRLNLNKVPTHVLVTTETLPIEDEEAENILKVIKACNWDAVPFEFFSENIVNTPDHDVIVPLESQKGGLEGPYVTHITNQYHGSLKNEQVISALISLLNARPEGEGSPFTLDGFDPVKLEYNYIPPASGGGPVENGTVDIFLPFLLSEYSPGDTVTIGVQGTGDVSQNWLYAGDAEVQMFAAYEAEQSPEFAYAIPEDYAGSLRFTALGFGENNFIDYDTAWITVIPETDPVSISADPQTLYIPEGTLAPVSATVLFEDGLERNVTIHSGTVYQLGNPALATVYQPGLIKGISPGSTMLSITFQGLSSVVDIVVLPYTPLALTLHLLQKQDVGCFGELTGAATVGASGGIPGYSYEWSNGGEGPTQTGLAPGIYSVTASDFDGNSATGQVTIGQADMLMAALTATGEMYTGGNDGTISASVSGGNPGYEYLWSNGDTSNFVSGLPPGDYCVTVSDANGCTTVECATVDPFCTPIFIEMLITPVSCYGNQDGTAAATVAGATQPFTVLWSNGETGLSVNNLSPGFYGLTVTGAEGCNAGASFEISEPTQVVIEITNQTNVGCAGDATGSAGVTVDGGTPPYVFGWDDPLFQTSPNVAGLIAGTYHVTITDAHGCTVEEEITITEPDPVSIHLDEIGNEMAGSSDGYILVSLNGGLGSVFSVVWYYDGEFFSDDEDIDGLSAGQYVIVAADSLGCIAQDTFLIENITSVDETNLLNKLKIFPNPASGMISVEVAPGLQDKIGFTFFDAVGRQVFPRRLEQANYRVFGFDVSEVPPGLLVVKVSANDREIYLGRVLINR